MYSKTLQNLFKAKKIQIGDKIKVEKEGFEYIGILMPKPETQDPNSIVLKLENGYNVGIGFEKEVKIELLEKRKKKEFEKLKIKSDPKKLTVSVLGCGGTIASKIEYETGAVYPAFTPEDLIQNFPKLKELANVKGRMLFNLFSEDMSPEHWKIIAKETAKEIKNSDGIVLTHGTDTLHYTSAALSFMLQNLPKPVVLVGSQRSSDRPSSDAEMNLICSVLTALSDIAEVVVCMHGEMSDTFNYVHSGVKVRKMHTSRRDTFKSINVLPYAKVWYEKREIEYLRNDFKKRGKRDLILDTKINPNVCLIWIHPGIKPEFVKSLGKFYDGVVLAGTGLGHVQTNKKDKFCTPIISEIENLINSGIPVAMSPQTIFGRINMNVYETGRKLVKIGVMGNYCDWTPETALVKLMWVLGHTKNMKKIKEMMEKNYVGEISERSIPEGFI